MYGTHHLKYKIIQTIIIKKQQYFAFSSSISSSSSLLNLHVFWIFFLFISCKSSIHCMATIIWKDKILQKIIIMNHINISPLPHVYLLPFLLFSIFMSSESSSSLLLFWIFYPSYGIHHLKYKIIQTIIKK